MDKRYFSDKIVEWYLSNKRNLPWRDSAEPYKIWLSEIILQQTRVSQGMPYYERFIAKYPQIAALANASGQEVLRLWQGLGYYTRARNLHKCAKTIVAVHGGKFPASYQKLLTLPGIGEYTAAAIASIAFRERVAVVDGNVYRVLSRVFGIDTAINSPKGKKIFQTLANELIRAERPDLHNQAVMEFGALHCTPKNPKCDTCIFQKNCSAYAQGLQLALPVKLRGRESRKRYFYYIVLENGNSLLMKKRTLSDIWLGLFDFHLIEKSRRMKPEKILQESPLSDIVKKSPGIRITKEYKHILTHQTIFTRFIIVKNPKNTHLAQEGHCFYSLKQIAKLPKPVLVSRFLREHYVF